MLPEIKGYRLCEHRAPRDGFMGNACGHSRDGGLHWGPWLVTVWWLRGPAAVGERTGHTWGLALVPGCCGGARWPRALVSWTPACWASLEVQALVVFALDGGAEKALQKRGCSWLLSGARAGERSADDLAPW
ncbi:hypothetical protein NDU88_003303 [Pleurodeles waltl]|uniref:Uncharacterized protein n=1 Tax=Pleurodeles waltl TaxID=8319 RepID=A0AAV7LL84_PLEWA|nr:hypothetical protein NDU88_003303 [Pleurodeles waltl]